MTVTEGGSAYPSVSARAPKSRSCLSIETIDRHDLMLLAAGSEPAHRVRTVSPSRRSAISKVLLSIFAVIGYGLVFTAAGVLGMYLWSEEGSVIAAFFGGGGVIGYSLWRIWRTREGDEIREEGEESSSSTVGRWFRVAAVVLAVLLLGIVAFGLVAWFSDPPCIGGPIC